LVNHGGKSGFWKISNNKNVLIGLMEPDSGYIEVLGKRNSHLDQKKLLDELAFRIRVFAFFKVVALV